MKTQAQAASARPAALKTVPKNVPNQNQGKERWCVGGSGEFVGSLGSASGEGGTVCGGY